MSHQRDERTFPEPTVGVGSILKGLDLSVRLNPPILAHSKKMIRSMVSWTVKLSSGSKALEFVMAEMVFAGLLAGFDLFQETRHPPPWCPASAYQAPANLFKNTFWTDSLARRL